MDEPFNLFDALIKTSLQGSVLVLLVLTAQRVFKRQLGPRWRHALWFLVLIRLVLPSTITSPASVFNLFAPSRANSKAPHSPSRPADPVAKEALQTMSVSASVSPTAKRSISQWIIPHGRVSHFPRWCVLVWAVGVAGFAAFLAVNHHKLRRKIIVRRPLTDSAVLELLEDCKEQMGIRAPVLLVETDEVGSPSLFGFVRPRLLLPSGLTKNFSFEELRYMLLHELAHIKRRDILVGWCMAVLQVVHWFNPLVWLAFRRMRADRELACDALALSFFGAAHAQAYGRTIIKLLEHFGRSGWAPSLAGAVESKQQLNERIAMIAEFNAKKRGTKLALLLCALLGAVAMTDAEPNPPDRKDLVGTWVLVKENGAVSKPSGQLTRLKFITETHWTITQADKKTGVVIFHHGGTYTLDGSRYVEKVEFANKNTSEGMGRKAKFEIKLDGDILHLHGIEGTPWQEDWKRIRVADLHDEKEAGAAASAKK